MRVDQLARPREHRTSGLRQMQFLAPAVGRGRMALDEIAGCQPVDEGHHRCAVGAERIGKVDLRCARIARGEFHHRELFLRQPKLLHEGAACPAKGILPERRAA